MKIIQLIPELNEGGVERGVVELSRELVKQGFESFVISYGGKLVHQLENDGASHVTLDVCSKNIFNAPWRIFQLYKTLKALNPDIIHARSRVPAWMAYCANLFLHIPFITTVHGFNSVNIYSRIMSLGDHVICVSNAIKHHIQKHYHTDEHKITVIPRGIDLSVFNPSHLDTTYIETFKEEFHLHNKWVVTTVGRITQLKDLETFIKAIAILKKEFPNITGLIVGGIRQDKQGYFEMLQELIKTLHVDTCIHFCGSSAHVAEIYSISNVVVSSSKKPESFGRSVAEAIALNIPVVATEHGGVLDIVKEGTHGYFSHVGDAKDLAEKIIKASMLKPDGYTYIQDHFSLKQMVEKTVLIYKRAIHTCTYS